MRFGAKGTVTRWKGSSGRKDDSSDVNVVDWWEPRRASPFDKEQEANSGQVRRAAKRIVSKVGS